MNKNEVMMRKSLDSVLRESGSISTKEATDLLNVSESTVRRLFDKLQQDGKAVRVFGGIRSASSSTKHLYDVAIERQRKARTDIGRFAASVVENNDFIFIDYGITTIYLCKFLAERIKRGDLTGVTVVTNYLKHLEMLSPYCNSILCSGMYNPDQKCFSGTLCESFVSQFHFTKAFVGADGFSTDEGFYTSDYDTSHLSCVAASLSDITYALVDSTKESHRSFMIFDRFEFIRNIITDSGISSESLEALTANKINVLIAK